MRAAHLVLALALLVALPAGCSPSSQGLGTIAPAYPADADAITVSAAENFYGELLHDLGGSRLRVYSFLNDPNADPHDFESSPAVARAVADSRLVVENGLGYDPFMDRLLRASPKPGRAVINAQDLVGAADGANPHLWYDPGTMPLVAQAAAAALVALDPSHAAAYRAGLDSYLSRQAAVSARVAAIRGRFAGAPVACTEPVYGYMTAALGLDVLTPDAFMIAVEQGNDPPSQATARQEDLVSKRQVKLLLYNSQTATRVTARIQDLARKSGVPVVGVSETEPPNTTFDRWQLTQLDAVERALGASA